MDSRHLFRATARSPAPRIIRTKGNAHRYVAFNGGRVSTFTTWEKDFLLNLAALFGHLNRISGRYSHQVSKLALTVMLIALAVLNELGHALPQGWEVVTGDVQIQQSGNVLNITSNSQQAIVNYQSFDVNAGETVNFNFLLPNSSLLNQILGNSASNIAGNVNANGMIALVNPLGINFADTAQINAASLIASTLSIQNSDYLAGNYVFSQDHSLSPAAVVNEGEIQADQLVLLTGGAVNNQGNIQAPTGQVHLAVGDQVTLAMGENHAISVTVNQALLDKVAEAQDAIRNAGAIDAHVVDIEAQLAQSFYQTAVNNTGIIKSTHAVVGADGKISLRAGAEQGQTIVRHSGVIDASGNVGQVNGGSITIEGDRVSITGDLLSRGITDGGVGGQIDVLGDEIALHGNALIDASGGAGGGSIRIGGDYQGKNPEIRNAQRVWITPDVDIQADAITEGDGGRVIVWADQSTQFYGDISAKGGDQGGNGGFVEVSGKERLNFQGQVYLGAAQGELGTLLLDPTDITIVDGAGADDAQLSDDQILSADAPATMIIGETTLEALASNANVILQATNDIIVQDLTDNWLNLQQTTGSVTLTADADNDGSGSFTMMDINDLISTQGGALTITAHQINAGQLSSNGGNLTLTANIINLNNNVSAGAGNLILREKTGSGDMALGDAAGAWSLDNTELGYLSANNIQIGSIANAGNIVLDNADFSASGANVTLHTTGQILDGSVGVDATPNITLAVNKNLNITGNGLGASTIGGAGLADLDIDLSGTGVLTLNTNNAAANIEMLGNANLGTINTGTGDLSILSAGGIDTSGIITSNALNLTSSANGNINFGASTSSSGLAIITANGTGDITQSAGTLFGSTINFLSGSGDIGSGITPIQTSLNVASFSTTGGAWLTNNTTTSLTASTVGTTLQVQAGNTLTVNGALIANDLSLSTTASNGNISLGADITGTNTVNLSTQGSGNITRSGAFTITGNTLSLNSGTGTFGVLGTALLTDAGTLSVNTGGSAYLQETDALNIGASTVGGTLELDAGDTITTTGALNGNVVQLQTTANNGDLQLAHNIHGTTLVELFTHGSGTLNNQATSTITSSNGMITLATYNRVISGSINAGATGIAAFRPSGDNDSIGLGGGAGAWTISNLELNEVSAGTVQIGSPTTTSAITINSHDFTSTNRHVNLVTTGTITDGTAGSDATANIILAANRNLGISGGTGTGSGTVGGAGLADIDIDLSGTGVLSLTTNNADAFIDLVNTGNVNTMATGTGDLTVLVSNAGFTNTGAVSGDDISITANDTITFNGAVTGNTVTASVTGNNGGIVLGADVTGTTSGSLTTHNTGNITTTGGRLIGGAMTLTTPGGSIGSGGTPFLTNIASLNFSAPTSVYISETNALSLTGTALTNALQVSAGGAITTTGALSADTIALTTTAANGGLSLGGNLTGATSIALTTNGSGNTTSSGTIQAPSLSLSTTAGSFGASGTPLQTNINTLTASGGSVFITEQDNLDIAASTVSGTLQVSTPGSVTTTGAVSGNVVNLSTTAGNNNITLNGNLNATSTGSLSANGTGTVIQNSGRVTGGTVGFTTGSDLGSSGSPILTTLTTVTANTTGNAYFSDLNGLNIGASTVTGDLQVSAAGTLGVTGAVSTNSFTLATSANGNITLGANLSATTTGNLNANGSGNITRTAGTVSGDTINFSSTSGDIGTSIAPIVTNMNTFTASTTGSVYISELNQLTIPAITVGGTLQVLAGDDMIVNGPISATDVHLETTANNGDMTLNGDVHGNNTVLLVTHGTGTLHITAPSDVTSTNGTITVQSNNLIVDGNVDSGGAGTLILLPRNSTDSIGLGDAAGVWTLTNAKIAQIHAQNIQIGNASTSGNISADNAQFGVTGANLILSTTGQIIDASPTDAVANIIMAANKNLTITGGGGTGSGVIGGAGLADLDVDLSGSGQFSALTNNANATVQLTNAGNTGTITLGTGDLSLVGDMGLNTIGVITADIIDLSTPFGLAIGNTVTGNTVNLSTTANNGNIDLNGNISATTGGTFTAHGSGNITQGVANTVSGGTVNFSSTTGDLGSSGATLKTNLTSLSANTAGNGYFTETNALNLGASTVSGTLQVAAGNTLTTTGAINTDTLSLSTTANNANLALNSNITASTSGAYTAHGSGTITQTGGNSVSGGSQNFNSTSGDIGSVGSFIQTNAASISANSTGSAYLQDSGSVSLEASTLGGTLNVRAGDDLTTTGAVSANNLTLQTTANNGDITLGANVTANTSGTISANGSGAITQSAGTISGGALAFSSTSGDIGTSGSNIQTNVTSLTANSSGSGYFNEANALSVGASTLGGTLQIHAAGALTNTGAISSDQLLLETTAGNSAVLLGADINATTSGVIRANGSGTVTQSAGTISGGAVTLESTSGDIGTGVTRIQTNLNTLAANTSGSAYINEANAVNIGTSTVGTLLDISAGGDIATAGNISSNQLNLTTTAANGSITVGHTANVVVGVTLATNGNGIIDIQASGTISSPNSSINLIAHDINVAGSVNAGAAGSITLQSNNAADALSLGSAAGTWQLNNTDLGNLSAGNIQIGSNTTSGDITADNADLSASGANITLRTTGQLLDGSAGTDTNPNIILGNNKNLTVTGSAGTGSGAIGGAGLANFDVSLSGSGTVTATSNNANINLHLTNTSGLGVINAGTANATILSDNALTINQAITASNISITAGDDLALNQTLNADTISLATQNNGDIALNTNLTGTTSLSIAANGSGNITQAAGTLTAPTLSLSSGTGNIGASGTPLQSDVTTITANTGGNAYINEVNTLNLGASTVTGTLQVTAADTLTTTGAINTGTLNLSTTANNANLALNSNINATNGALTAHGSGNITQAGGNTVSGGSVSFNSTTGNIGTVGTPLQTNLTTASANTGGNVYLADANGLNLGASTVGGTLHVETADDLSITGAISGNIVELSTTAANGDIVLGANIAAAASGTISAHGSGAITQSAGIISGGSVGFSSTSGDIGSSSTPIQTNLTQLSASTTGNAYLNETNALTINASTIGGTMQVISGGSITSGGNTTANILSWSTGGGNGDITLGHTITGTTSGALSTHGTGIVNIQAAGALTSTNTLNLTARDVIIDGALSTAAAGQINIASNDNSLSIGLGGATGTLSLNNTDLSHISTGTLQIGSNSTTGTISADNANLAPTGAHLILNTSGTVTDGSVGSDATDNLILGNNKNLTITGNSGTGSGQVGATGIADLDVTLSGTGQVNVKTNSADVYLNLTGTPTLGTIDVGSANLLDISSTSSLTVAQALSANRINLSTVNDLTINSTFTANELYLTTGAGGSLNLNTALDHGVININTGNSLAVNHTIDATTLSITSTNNITINSEITTGTLTLQTTANNGAITLNEDITASTSGLIQTHGNGLLSQLFGKKIMGGNFDLVSTSGDIGTLASPIRLQLNPNRVTANTLGNVYLWGIGYNFPVNTSTVGGAFTVYSEGDITQVGLLTGNPLTLLPWQVYSPPTSGGGSSTPAILNSSPTVDGQINTITPQDSGQSVNADGSGTANFGQLIDLSALLESGIIPISYNGGNGGVDTTAAILAYGGGGFSLSGQGGGQTLYAINPNAKSVSVTNAQTGAPIQQIAVGKSPWAIITHAPTQSAYVSNAGSNSVSIINTQTNTVTANVRVGQDPRGLTISPDGSRVYVANFKDNTVSVISPTAQAVTQTISTGNKPIAVAIDNSGQTLYVANFKDNTVSMINTTNGQTQNVIPTGQAPKALALSPDGSQLYVANSGSKTISIINTHQGRVTRTLTVNSRPSGLSISQDGSMLYVSDTSHQVQVINLRTDTTQATISASQLPSFAVKSKR